jgi:hypothetical protein
MSYVIRRDSPFATNPEAKTLWVSIATEREYAYTTEETEAKKFDDIETAMGYQQLAKRDSDARGVRYTVVEV